MVLIVVIQGFKLIDETFIKKEVVTSLDVADMTVIRKFQSVNRRG